MDLDRILKVAVRGGASDVILKTGEIPRFRFNGNLVPLSDGHSITPEIMAQWITKIIPERMIEKSKTGDCDFAYQAPNGNRFRVNLFKQRASFGLVFRIISTHVKSLEELQLPAILSRLTLEKRGLILVTGATGSGKSTTLAAMIQKVNEERAAHIITIEDPIEFSFRDARSTINQREVGQDTESFSIALRAALRQNPDIILVGELRDKETTETALMAAETGHLVLSTLHTSDAVESLTRILSFFPPHAHSNLRQVLANALLAVISQRLVRTADGKGMTAANEILISNANVKETILKTEDFGSLHKIIEEGQDTYGMLSFDHCLYELYHAGIITYEEALAQASRRDNLLLKIRGVGA
jgi:twitching motility protein PilT